MVQARDSFSKTNNMTTPGYTLIRSTRRKRSLSMRLDSAGEVIVRAPKRTPKLLIDQFVMSKSAWISKQRLSISSDSQLAPTPNFTTQELKDYISKELTHYTHLMGLTPQEVKFTRVKSYWGNCSSKGVIRFNLQLVYATPEAVSYVVVHELAHLRYQGHGKRFWNLVNQVYPRASLMRRHLNKLKHLPLT